jgi:hypothetical protein
MCKTHDLYTHYSSTNAQVNSSLNMTYKSSNPLIYMAKTELSTELWLANTSSKNKKIFFHT